MQQNRRRPLGDIGNTYGVTAARTKPPQLRIPSLGSLLPATSSSTPCSPHFDDKNKENALHATEYVKEIFDLFRKTEMNGRASTAYMSRIQTDVNEKMRVILIDWLVDVHLKFKLLPETLFLAVEIIDRFLDKKVVSRQKLQLVGVVAMLLAAKYEEIYPPEVKDFIYIAANTYTRDDILRMERLMFATLDFNITFPTAYAFLKRALQVTDAEVRTQQLAQFLTELCLLDYKMLQYAPSLIGASCVYLANKYLGKEQWPQMLEHYCQYTTAEVEHCAGDIQIVVQNAPQQKTQAVRKKYSYAKYGEVSKFVPPSV